MRFACVKENHLVMEPADFDNQSMLAQACWIDLYNPTPEELKKAERILSTKLPSRQKMNDIELSSRLIMEGNLIQMTCSLVSELDLPHPEISSVTFILTANRLITLRYHHFKGFQLFETHLQQQHDFSSMPLLLLLLDSLIEKRADGIELLDQSLAAYSKKLLHKTHDQAAPKLDYHHLMLTLGKNGDAISKNSHSLISLRRLITFLSENAPNMQHAQIIHCRSMQKDLSALCNHADFLANKITFLLESTLGMINIEQNMIVKVFSVLAVFFMPPTLIASIYGMNFHPIPELSYKYGYYFALLGMILTAWIPYHLFKRKKWL